MGRSNKEKKLAKKARVAQLKEKLSAVRHHLEKAHDTEAVQYVPSDDSEEEEPLRPSVEDPTAPQKPSPEVGEEEEDRVRLPSLLAAASASKRDQERSRKRKRNKMTWQELKLAAIREFGPEAAELAEEHDGNSEDPLFTIRMKLIPRSVPVPRHWSRLRAYMSNQADREEATQVVPAEIAALGVEKLRASKDKKANPNQMAFVTCFLTGTPLRRKTFGVPMTSFGETFYEGKWLPPARPIPGVLSQRLRQALGMDQSTTAPPPWLYSMQHLRRLPPAYPTLRIPGLNAPIPAGAQWGTSRGQWGEPPRAQNNSFLFPGVMGEAADALHAPTFWGSIPPLKAGAAAPPTTAPVAPEMPVKKQAPAAPAAPAAPSVAVNPVPFVPTAYQPNPRAGPFVPREYSKVQDTGSGTVAGHKMVPKAPGK